jgi:hypothetical protein
VGLEGITILDTALPFLHILMLSFWKEVKSNTVAKDATIR